MQNIKISCLFCKKCDLKTVDKISKKKLAYTTQMISVNKIILIVGWCKNTIILFFFVEKNVKKKTIILIIIYRINHHYEKDGENGRVTNFCNEFVWGGSIFMGKYLLLDEDLKLWISSTTASGCINWLYN